MVACDQILEEYRLLAGRRRNTVKTCEFVLSRFTAQFGKRDLASISPKEVLTFLLSLTEDNKSSNTAHEMG